MIRLAAAVTSCAWLALAACTGDIIDSNPGATADADPAAPDADRSTPDAATATIDAAPGAPDAPPPPPPPDANLPSPDEPPALAGITAAHNAVRAGVGVPPLTWQPALAATAQAWAEQCIDNSPPTGLIDHNPDRSVGHPYYVGENIYGSSGTASPTAAVNLWAAEAADYDYDTNTCAPGAVCGHYTQVVWAATEEVGCGISSCPGLTYGNNIVCNYGPGGNTGGRPY